MADQKLNEIPQVQSSELANVKAFFALMANGEIRQMSKEDMASVVGGLLKLANENGTIGTYGELKDFNQCTKNGYYRVMGKSEDILNACPITYGIMDVRGENEPYKLQVVFDLTKKQIAYRMYGDSKWNEWYVY